MIAQYPWASIKARERKYIEIAMIITMLMSIAVFYSFPEFETSSPTLSTPSVKPLETITIPPTRQDPPREIPQRPLLPVPAESDDVELIEPDAIKLDPTEWGALEAPPAPPPQRPRDANELDWNERPIPVGGWSALASNISYPELAQEAGIQGTVLIKAVIGVDGSILEAKVIKGVPNTGLNEAALEALMMTPFKPAMQMDKPVAVSMEIPITFRLK